MNEYIAMEIGTWIVFAIVISIFILILIWLFIRSAIKSGVEGAINSEWYSQIIRNETKEAILDAMVEAGLADEIKVEQSFKQPE